MPGKFKITLFSASWLFIGTKRFLLAQHKTIEDWIDLWLADWTTDWVVQDRALALHSHSSSLHSRVIANCQGNLTKSFGAGGGRGVTYNGLEFHPEGVEKISWFRENRFIIPPIDKKSHFYTVTVKKKILKHFRRFFLFWFLLFFYFCSGLQRCVYRIMYVTYEWHIQQ